MQRVARGAALLRLLGAASEMSGSGISQLSRLEPLCHQPSAATAACPLPSQTATGQLRTYAKAPKNKGQKPAAAQEPPAGVAQEFDLSVFKEQMRRAVEHLQLELANVRTGRATPGLLDHLKVEAYGERSPLKACATVSVRDPQLLVATVFDPSAADAVAKAIQSSPLGLSPRVEGQEVLVPIPRPTADTLKAMGKVCRQEAEQAKVSVRHVRKLALEEARRLAAGEDAQHALERQVQRLTDEVIADVEALVAAKEKDIAAHNC